MGERFDNGNPVIGHDCRCEYCGRGMDETSDQPNPAGMSPPQAARFFLQVCIERGFVAECDMPGVLEAIRMMTPEAEADRRLGAKVREAWIDKSSWLANATHLALVVEAALREEAGR